MPKKPNHHERRPKVDRSNSLVGRITELEKSSRRLEPDSPERAEVTRKATDYVDRFVTSLSASKAYIAGDCSDLTSWRVERSEKSFTKILRILGNEVDHIGINSSSGANFAYIQSGGIWASAIADMLAAATNRYAGVYYSSPGAVTIENQMIRWICSIAGYPETAHGNLTSGGSIANLSAIQTARDSSGINSSNVKKSVVYMTEHAHHCIDKALHTTGLDEAVRRQVPMDSRYRMDASALRAAVEDDEKQGLRPFLVVASAGTTDTGAIDPLDSIADICHEHKVWFHVDAAYGGFFVLLDELKERFKGIESSDSLVMDPHKSLFLPFGIGAVVVRDGAALVASNSHQAPYMQDALGHGELSPADSGPELTKHFRGLRMWLPLHLYGLDVFRANLEEKILLSRYFNEEIRRLGFETGPDPDLSISLFRFAADERNDFNKRLLDSIRKDGRVFFSSTEINGEFWIRCAVLSFRTHLREIRLALNVIGEKLESLHRR